MKIPCLDVSLMSLIDAAIGKADLHLSVSALVAVCQHNAALTYSELAI